MPRTEFIATGFYVPPRVVTNDELAAMMDTTDEWITQRTGIKERHWVEPGTMCAALAHQATQQALERAGLQASDLDCIVFATASPDHFFPGNGVFLQRMLGVTDIPALDVRNQCTGFIYGLSVADAWVRTGQYRRVLWWARRSVAGPRPQHRRPRHGRDLRRQGRGRDSRSDRRSQARRAFHPLVQRRPPGRSSDGLPGLTHVPWISARDDRRQEARIKMEGRRGLQHATTQDARVGSDRPQDQRPQHRGHQAAHPHQANQRISEMVQKQLGLRDDQVFNNIRDTAIPRPPRFRSRSTSTRSGTAVARELLILTAFGSGFPGAAPRYAGKEQL
jgi:3-oxoacyl-[acyl-carrier-protein] synthase-3